MLTLNFISGMHTFFLIILIFIFAAFGICSIVLAIYFPIKDRKFRKKGVPVRVTVKKVTEDTYTNEDNQKIRKGYNVTFEFLFNDKKKQKTIWTKKKFKIGSIKNGIYYEDDKKNILSVEGQGFYINKEGSLFLATFGLFVLFILSCWIFNFSLKTLFAGIITYFTLLFCSKFLLNFKKKKSISNETNTVDKIYYENANNNEYSTVSDTLVRYIPKPKYKNMKKKSNKGFSINLFTLIFVGLGSLLSIIGGISTFYALKVKFTFPSTIAEIKDVYKYTVETDNGISEETGIIYKYTVNKKEYILDERTGRSFELNTKEIGDKEKIYYEKNNPKNAVIKSFLGTMIIPFIMGIMFIYVGIYSHIDNKRKNRLYNAYLLKGEK